MAVEFDADINNLDFFLGLTSDAYLKVFPNSNWADLVVNGKVWIYSFHNTWQLGNPMVGSKYIASGSELMHSAQFSRYLNHFSSDFDPQVVIGNGIRYSLQWYLFQPILMVGSKLSFRALLGVSLRSNFVKIDKNL